MKVSQIIELALKNEYGLEKPFMCNCVHNLHDTDVINLQDGQKTIDAIGDLLKQIAGPDGIPSVTLVGTLWDKGYLLKDETIMSLPYTTELYVWWVFDLKRKGL